MWSPCSCWCRDCCSYRPPAPSPRYPRPTRRYRWRTWSVTAAEVGLATPEQVVGSTLDFARVGGPGLDAASWRWLGYLWLLVGSIYLLLRCLFDLTLVQRPALAPNLTFGGLAWFAGTLFICLVVVAFRSLDGTASGDASKGVGPATAPVGPQSGFVRTAATAAVGDQLAGPLVGEGMAVFCHLVVVVGLVVIGRVHFQDTAAGMGAATFYLLLPYTGLYVSQGITSGRWRW